MPRLPDIIVDTSPLTSTTVDVPLRVGWLLRTCRLTSPLTSGLTGQAFAREIGVGPALLTKWEKATEDIDASSIAAYERATGLAEGSLRGTIETTRRRFGHSLSTRLSATHHDHDLEALSRLTWPAMHGDPRGTDWLHFADALAVDGALVLPDFTAGPVVDRLVSELARSVGSAFLTRAETAARLRTGPYRTVTLRSLLAFALADDSQIAEEPLEIAAELPSAQLCADMCRLLLDSRRQVFEGACYALRTMLEAGPARGLQDADLVRAMPKVVEAYDSVAHDARHHRLLSETLRRLPQPVLAELERRIARPLAPAPDQAQTLSRTSWEYRTAQTSARRILGEVPVRDDAVLERVLFEALFDPVWAKRYCAGYFLLALPYREAVVAEVARLAEDDSRPQVRQAAVRLLMRTGGPSVVPHAERWVAEGDPAQRRSGLRALGNWADDIDPVLLDRLVEEEWDVAQRALYAAGMTSNPILARWSTDERRPQRVRAAARWWMRHGGRIIESSALAPL